MTIQGAIREYVLEQGIKQSFIANKCHWSRQKVSAILSEKQGISAGDHGVLCEALGVPYDFFYKRRMESMKNEIRGA